MYLLSIQTRQQLRFHSVSRSPDVRSRYFTKEGNAFLSFVWNAKERNLERVRNANGTRSERKWNAFGTQMERVRNAFGTRSERVRNAFGTRSGRVLDAFGTQMERERSVRLFLSSTVYYFIHCSCFIVFTIIRQSFCKRV